MSRYTANIITRNPATPTGPTTTGRAPGIWRLDDVAYWTRQGLWPNANIQAADSFFPYVSLLLSSTSLSNANNNLFVDSSGAFNPVSRFGNTTQGAFSPYSTNWSNYFSSSYISAPNNAAFAFGTGDFTVEMWVYLPAYGGGINTLDTRNGDTSTGMGLYLDGSGVPGIYVKPTSYSFTGAAVALNTWTHVAYVRSGTTMRAYVNGVGTSTVSMSTNFTDNGCRIGANINATPATMTGYLSNVRIVKGTAVYTANFTPPTAPLTAISGTSILTCQSNRFRDASSNNFTVTPTGSTSVQDFGPFNPTYPGAVYNQSDITNWSGYFDGVSNQYLSVANNSALDLPSNLSFTIEGWIYPTRPNNGAQSGFRNVVSKRVANSLTSNYNIMLWFNSEKLGFYNGSTSSLSNGSVQLNAWTHFAYVYDGASSLKLYLNGTLDSTFAVAPGATNSAPVTIGSLQDDTGTWDNFGGSISNIRIVKGSQVYTSNFTPPTTNLTAISGTSLLTCQNAAFTDNSTNNFIVTQNGNPTVTGNSPFNTVGYWSNYFGSTNTGALESILSVPASSAIDIGAGDFTVECWVYITAAQNYSRIIQFNNTWNSAGAAALIYANTDTQKLAVAVFDFSAELMAADSTYKFNTWYHVAVTRSGSTFSMYVNGVKQAATYTSSSRLWATTTPTMSIGNGPTNAGGFSPMQGYVSNVRVIKGTAIYTANFTPPTSPLTAVSGTAILTCQNGRFIDNSTNALTLTPGSNTSVQAFDPFYTATIASGGGSMYFDGSDYLAVASNGNLPARNAAYTIEAWIYPTAINANNGVIGWGTYGTNNAVNAIKITSTQIFNYWWANDLTGNFTFTTGQWYHIVAQFDGTTRSVYVNGTRLATDTPAGHNVPIPVTNATVGVTNSTEYFTGYITGVKVTGGAALYSGASYTVPTAPATPTASTTLLVNGMNAGIYDAAAINDMETVGNAQVSTAQSKFGGSSVYFDGSGDYLSIPTGPQLYFGTSDFTVEAWIYPTGGTGNRAIFSGNTTNAMAFYINTSGKIAVAKSGVVEVIASTTTISTSTFTHVAATRSGNTFRIFVNGTLEATVTSSQDFTSFSDNRVGYESGSSYYQGYIDDLRVTRGVARYTANFTPPTAPFAPY